MTNSKTKRGAVWRGIRFIKKNHLKSQIRILKCEISKFSVIKN